MLVQYVVDGVLLQLDAPNEVANRIGELDVEEFRAQLMHAARQRVQEAERREFEESGVDEDPVVPIVPLLLMVVTVRRLMKPVGRVFLVVSAATS